MIRPARPLPLLALLLLSALSFVPARPAAAEDGFAFALERLRVVGSGAFDDEFLDGSTTTPPTSRLVPRDGTQVQEGGGALLFLADDGAAALADPQDFEDRVLSVDGIENRVLQTTVFAEWRPSVPTVPGSGFGLVAASIDDAGNRLQELRIGLFVLSGREPFYASLAASCRFAGTPVVVLVDETDTALGCDPVDPGRLGGDDVVFRFFFDGIFGECHSAYSLDGGFSFVPANAWLAASFVPVAFYRVSRFVFPGAFARGEVRAAWRSDSLASEIATAPGGAMTGYSGDLHDSDGDARAPFSPSGAALPGFLASLAEPGQDVRLTPSGVSLVTAGASAIASAERTSAARRVDPATGRPLAPGAPPDASCASGAEPACLTAPSPIAPSAAAFAAICRYSRGFLAFDPAACRLDVWRSQAPVLGLTLAQAWSIALGGEPGFASTMIIVLGGLVGTPAAQVLLGGGSLGEPLVAALGVDPGDTGAIALDGRLSPAQQALLGCGPYLGTSCHQHGMRLLAEGDVPVGAGAEAAVLVQSFPGAGGEAPAGFVTTSGPQPGTLGGPAPPLPARDVAGAPVWLPGARGPGDPGYAPATDGGVAGLVHPFTGAPFRSEAAALSWNLLLLLVTQSRVALPGAPAGDELDPAAPLRTDGCSFAVPQRCREVQAFLSVVRTERSDDPSGSPRLRWAWETGFDARVVRATGPLAVFAGGQAFVVGPVEPAQPGPAASTTLVLSPPPPASFDADGDGIADPHDLCPGTPSATRGDRDGDGVGDACDNCPFVANASQLDRGGVGTGSPADGIGDACQCGDVNGDGRVSLADGVAIRRSLLVPPTAVLARPQLCDVSSTPDCSLTDAVTIQRALLLPPLAAVAQRCAPAKP